MCTTPFGFPVVPLEYWMNAGSSGLVGWVSTFSTSPETSSSNGIVGDATAVGIAGSLTVTAAPESCSKYAYSSEVRYVERVSEIAQMRSAPRKVLTEDCAT